MRKLREVSNWTPESPFRHWTGLTDTTEGMFFSAASTSETAARNPIYKPATHGKYNKLLMIMSCKAAVDKMWTWRSHITEGGVED